MRLYYSFKKIETSLVKMNYVNEKRRIEHNNMSDRKPYKLRNYMYY